MRIIGGRDYYDGVQSLGIDKTIVFLRGSQGKCRSIKSSESDLRPLKYRTVAVCAPRKGYYQCTSYVDTKYGRFYFEPLVVWFAGERHAGIKMTTDEKAKNIGGATFWRHVDLIDFLDSIGCKIAKGFWPSDSIKEGDIDEFFSSRSQDKEIDWLVKNRVSIAISENGSIFCRHNEWEKQRSWNLDVSGLSDIGFASIIPPYEAFQKLSMWVGGVLGTSGNEMIEIKDDKVKRDKHGFDKWSFKKKKVLK